MNPSWVSIQDERRDPIRRAETRWSWTSFAKKRKLDRETTNTCAMVKSRYIGDGHPSFNRNPYNGHINPYYRHPLLYGNNRSLDPGTHSQFFPYTSHFFHSKKT